METIHITVPKGATNVNLQMNMAPENYFGVIIIKELVFELKVPLEPLLMENLSY